MAKLYNVVVHQMQVTSTGTVNYADYYAAKGVFLRDAKRFGQKSLDEYIGLNGWKATSAAIFPVDSHMSVGILFPSK